MIYLWVVYDHPKDFPDAFVARRFRDAQPTAEYFTAPDLQQLRGMLPKGLTRFPRHPSDDPVIVEMWM